MINDFFVFSIPPFHFHSSFFCVLLFFFFLFLVTSSLPQSCFTTCRSHRPYAYNNVSVRIEGKNSAQNSLHCFHVSQVQAIYHCSFNALLRNTCEPCEMKCGTACEFTDEKKLLRLTQICLTFSFSFLETKI